MPTRRRTAKDSLNKLAKRMSRRWRVVLMFAKWETLGEVEAPDATAAVAAAVVQLSLGRVPGQAVAGVRRWCER